MTLGRTEAEDPMDAAQKGASHCPRCWTKCLVAAAGNIDDGL
jgi:hypothetical protein